MRTEEVMIGLSAYGGMVTTGVAKFLSGIGKGTTRRWTLAIAKDSFGHANARNVLCKAFLDSDADRLWFLDHDMIPPLNAEELLDVDGDVVGAYYQHPASPTNGFKQGAMVLQRAGDGDVGGGVMSVHGIGMGATVIRRKVMEDPAMRLPSSYVGKNDEVCELGPDEPPAIFQFRWTANGAPLLGEDFDFCIRAREAGYSVLLNQNVRFGHLKTVALGG